VTIRWVPKHLVIGWHAELLKRYGGAAGLRDEGLLEAALDRARNIHGYEPDSSVTRLAAGYAFGLARNHPFVDGNKRIAFAVMVTFLGANGLKLDVAESAATEIMLTVAAGSVNETELQAWLDEHCIPDVTPSSSQP
jgi:death-on-curing protein